MAWNSAAAAVQVVQEVNRVQRKTRGPTHTHLLEHSPFAIQPFMIAPVLAGETLKNLNLQSRVITDPLASGAGNILPWWCDHYYFYVKIRQLPLKDAFEQMVLTGSDLGVINASDPECYFAGNGVNWVRYCLTFIVERGGFRDDTEDQQPMIGTLPAAKAYRHGVNWADSMIPDAAIDVAGGHLQNPEDDAVLSDYQVAYQRMRDMRIIDFTFEDYLRQQGVSLPQQGLLDRPELIRVSSEWTYPTNTVEATTGAPSAAASWSVNVRADKDRFFNEPGFIVGVTVVRPKLFMANQRQSAVVMMDKAESFLPRILAGMPEVSVRKFLGGADGTATGPLNNQTLGYWVDTADLLRYGDQFVKFADAKGYRPALPSAAGSPAYMPLASISALFADATKAKIRQDGVTRLSILGHPQTVVDQT